MSKRAANPVTAGTKRSKPDPITQKCQAVTDALTAIDTLSEDTLIEFVPCSLGVAAKDRHDFQNRMVEAIGVELAKHVEHLEKQVAEAEARIVGLDAEKLLQQKMVADLEEDLNSKESINAQHKALLATNARIFQTAKATLEDSQEKQIVGDNEANQAEAVKDGIEDALSNLLRPLKEGSVPVADPAKTTATLMKTLGKHMKLDDSLVRTIPLVFSKEQSLRGKFDNMAAQKLEDDVVAQLEILKQSIAQADTMRANRVEVVRTSQMEFDSCKKKQLEAATQFRESRGNAEAAATMLQSEKKKLGELSTRCRKAGKVKYTAEGERDVFKEGPMVAFEELRNLSIVTEQQILDTTEDMIVEPNQSN